MTLSVMESTQVVFSSGFFVEKITTGFESDWLAIEDVPITVDRAAIEKLVAPFGEAQDVRFRDERRSDDPASRAVKLRMATYHEAVRAVNELDGSEAFGRRISVQLSLSKRLTNRLLRDSVRVSWPVPCKAGYAGYDTLEAAQNAVSKADGTSEQDRWITASMYQSIPYIANFNVRSPDYLRESTKSFWASSGRQKARCWSVRTIKLPGAEFLRFVELWRISARSPVSRSSRLPTRTALFMCGASSSLLTSRAPRASSIR
jgi:hypothetical protein